MSLIKQEPFNLFGQNQTIYFDLTRLEMLEVALGKSIINVVQNQDFGINFCTQGLLIGMKHHYHKADKDFFRNKISEHLQSGGSLGNIIKPLLAAIVKTGILGPIDEDESERKNELTQ